MAERLDSNYTGGPRRCHPCHEEWQAFPSNSIIAADAAAMPRKDDRGTELENVVPRDRKAIFEKYDAVVMTRNNNKHSLSDNQDLDAIVKATLHLSGDETPPPILTTTTTTTSSDRDRGKMGKPRYLEVLEVVAYDRKATFEKYHTLVKARNNNKSNLADQHPADAKVPLYPSGGGTSPTLTTTTTTTSGRGTGRGNKPRSAGLAGPGWWRRLPPPTAPTQDYVTTPSPSPPPPTGVSGGPERKRSVRDDDDERGDGSHGEPFPSGGDNSQEEPFPSGGDGSREKQFPSGGYGSQEEPYPLVTVLKVGDVLRGKLHAADGLCAVWPDVDGSVMFGRYVPLALDEYGREEEDSGKIPSYGEEEEEYSRNTPNDREEGFGKILSDRKEEGESSGKIPSNREEEKEGFEKIPSDRSDAKEGYKNVPSYRQGEDSVNIPQTTLVRSNIANVKRALKLRRMVIEELKKLIMEAKEGGGGGEKNMGKGDAWGWLPWRRRAERELARSRWCSGQVEMTIDDRACVQVTLDGTPVTSKSGMFEWEVLNRLPWRWPKDNGYEVHVVGDGIEVQLGGRIVWGVFLEDIRD